MQSSVFFQAVADENRQAWYPQPQRTQAYDIFRGTVGDEHPHTKLVKQWMDALSVK